MEDVQILTIPNDAKVDEIIFTSEFSTVCVVGGVPFNGTVIIDFKPVDKLLEFESFEKWLRSIALDSYTIESFTRLCFDKLTEALGDISLSVEVCAQTTVHASASAIIERGEW